MLLENMLDEINQTVKNTLIMQDKKFGIAFSGGIDSTILSKICENNLKNRFILLTIGFPNSNDIEFAKKIALQLDQIDHKILEIDSKRFAVDLKFILENNHCNNISHIENCLAFYYISLLAKKNKLKLVITANGFDELFCGYDIFRRIYDNGEEEIKNMIDKKLKNEHILMNEINNITNKLDIQIKQPFLSKKFISFAKKIPIENKIKGNDDYLRKHILRDLAVLINVPNESSMRPKKALQYGSQIHKNVLKVLVRNSEIKNILEKKKPH